MIVALLLMGCANPAPAVFLMQHAPDGVLCGVLTSPIPDVWNSALYDAQRPAMSKVWGECCKKVGARVVGGQQLQDTSGKYYGYPLCAIGGAP